METEDFIKIILIVLSITIISVLLIKRFMYFNPSFTLLPYKEHYQNITQGNLHGWFVRGSNGKVVLICHGNSGNISDRQHLIDSLHELGYSVIIFDYSGYGLSKGIPSENQFYQDGSIFMDFTIKEYHKNDIIVYGESIGAPVAAYLVRKYYTPILIIDSGLPSIQKYIKGKIKLLSFLSFLFPEFDTEKYVNGYKGKILFMHSLNDEVIPYEITENIRNLSTHIIKIQGTHNNRNIPWKDVNEIIQS
jgi:hypothetical protein